MIKALQTISLPFSLVYGFIQWLRNSLYDLNVFKSYQPPIPTIIVGNLSMGGTGKTPHVELLIEELQAHYKIAVLSRGYGRKTSGYREIQLQSNAQDVGDEPLQIFSKFPTIPFAVCENRATGIKKLMAKYPELDLIILDDAMQHRRVKGSFVILMSLFNKPFFKDWVVPSGRLREFAFLGKKRADVCIYSKCPIDLSQQQIEEYTKKFSPKKKSYFSRFEYGAWQLLSLKSTPENIEHVHVVTGIAFPEVLVNHLKQNFKVSTSLFQDHHDFSGVDISKIYRKLTTFDPLKTAIVCTEKDAVKLNKINEVSQAENFSWYVIPIRANIENKEELLNQIHHYVRHYSISS